MCPVCAATCHSSTVTVWVQSCDLGAACTSQGMTESEYTALIPRSELLELQALLEQVYQARGWSTSSLFCQAAWQEVLQEATSDPEDPWSEQLPASSMQPERLGRLSDLLDRAFLGGQLQAWLRAQGRACVRFLPVSQAAGPDDWYANFFPQENTVALRRSRWAEEALVVTPQRPADYEGIQCTCRLQVRDMPACTVNHCQKAASFHSPTWYAASFRMASIDQTRQRPR